MRFCNRAHSYYCGVDLHARTLSVCILDQQSAVLLRANLSARPHLLTKKEVWDDARVFGK
jgi:hypothetical protein